MNILTNIITYFAKFPARAGVLNNFASSTEKYPGYQALKTAIQNLPSPLLPEIEEMVFSTSEIAIADKLRNMNGFFILFEYGALTGSKGYAGGRGFEINLAITVGHPLKQGNNDIMIESLLMDKCLSLIAQILQQMEADNDGRCYPSRLLEGSINIAPAEPTLLYNNLGWVVSFKNNETLI